MAACQHAATAQAGEAWRRLVCRFHAYPWALFEAVSSRQPHLVFDRASKLLEKCSQCIDDEFTLQLLRWWEQGQQHRALRALNLVARSTPVTTLATERTHARDRALLQSLDNSKGIPVMLGLTFLARICRAFNHRRRIAEQRHLGRLTASNAVAVESEDVVAVSRAAVSRMAERQDRLQRLRAKEREDRLVDPQRGRRGGALLRSWVQGPTPFNAFYKSRSASIKDAFAIDVVRVLG